MELNDTPLLPEGRYEMVYQNHRPWRFLGRQPKVVIEFCIVEPGEYLNLVIPAYYPVIAHLKGQRFKVSKKSDLYRDFCRVFFDQPPPRPDRLPLTNLAGVVIFGHVKTVCKGYDQRVIPEIARYSRVKSIERWSAS